MTARNGRSLALAATLVCASSSYGAYGADLVFDVGVGHLAGVEATQSYGIRGSLGLDIGTLEPAPIALWSPGPSPGAPALLNPEGGQVLHGFAALLRVHTPPPHEASLGVGFGFGRVEVAQNAGPVRSDRFVYAYRGTTGPYTAVEIAYRYSAGSLMTFGAAFTTHFFTHVDALGEVGPNFELGSTRYGVMPFFSLMADVGLHLSLF